MVNNRSKHFRYPGGKKSLLGMIAYLVEYVLIIAWKGNSIDNIFEEVTVESRYQSATLAETFASADVKVSAMEGSGWLLYNAHHISVTVPTPAGTTTKINFLSTVGGDSYLVFLIPPIVLVLVGMLATYGASSVQDLRFDLGDTPFVRYWYNGAFPVLFGYVPFAVFGAPAFWVDGFGAGLLFSWVLAGMVYPFLFAGLGGVIAKSIWYEN